MVGIGLFTCRIFGIAIVPSFVPFIKSLCHQVKTLLITHINKSWIDRTMGTDGIASQFFQFLQPVSPHILRYCCSKRTRVFVQAYPFYYHFLSIHQHALVLIEVNGADSNFLLLGIDQAVLYP